MAKEPSRQKFVELVEPRTSMVLDKMDVLGKLARPRDYAYTAADVDAIEAALVGKVNEIIGAFRNPSAATHEPTFKLGGNVVDAAPASEPDTKPERATAAKKSA